MFSSLGLLNQFDCPEQSHCSLSNCLFAHHILAARTASDINDFVGEEPRKRQRLTADGDNSSEVRVAGPTVLQRQQQSQGLQPKAKSEPHKAPLTASRPVSPPLLRNAKPKASESASAKESPSTKVSSNLESKLNGAVPLGNTVVEATLNPRMLPNPPAPHAVRMQLIAMIHKHMVQLNTELWQTNGPTKSPLTMSAQELIIEALEEEEKAATQNPQIYSNIVKLRIVRLKKMKLPEWKEERLKQVAKRVPIDLQVKPLAAPRSIETGLSIPEKIAFLTKIVANQGQLSKHGYVPIAPTENEVIKARQGVEAAQGWEQCDRCKTRFQVFPGRREEDGALTSGGQCTYHPAKPRKPQPKDKSDKVSKDAIYGCCNETVGVSSGCTKGATHVFKISDPKRLEVIMPFKETPPKLLTPGPNIAVCFDCEMGYTTQGLELIRLTATSWPEGEELLDVLVRPLGEVLDLNSQFSGVFPSDYADAIPYDTKTEDGSADVDENTKPKLRLVESPFVARDLLFELLTPETPLIGHALDNDLNATRIIHPSIVDTVLLYPHPRGLPVRHGLKMLMKKHLDRDIQMGGAQGHDSKEDAQAAGELVRLKVADMWKAMKRDGWTVTDRKFLPPVA
ncbi:RNA exonuclease, partial [Lecanoromycetidae sp. Uapishka_2]